MAYGNNGVGDYSLVLEAILKDSVGRGLRRSLPPLAWITQYLQMLAKDDLTWNYLIPNAKLDHEGARKFLQDGE